jgi:NAD(P)-dependent dehydrogenase (short-subunit alcohol dehydrogenase family)
MSESYQLLAGRSAVITGAAHGIGRGIAVRFAAEGVRVVIADIDTEAGTQVAEDITSGGGSAVFCKTDVTLETDIANLIKQTVEQFGGLDILVNNAGITPRKPFEQADSAYWQHTLALNLTSMFLAARYARPHLENSTHASIVNIASLHAFTTVKGLSTYAASKGGVISLTRGLALELAPSVRVNAIIPGLIETERVRVAMEQTAEHARRLSVHPLGRIGSPEDIAAAAVFLVSDQAAFITGVALPVDGGLSIQLWRD